MFAGKLDAQIPDLQSGDSAAVCRNVPGRQPALNSRLAQLPKPSARRLKPRTRLTMAKAGKQGHQRPDVENRHTLLDHAAPIRIRRRQAETKKAEDTDGNDSVADAKAGIDDQHATAIGQKLDQHDVERAFGPSLAAAIYSCSFETKDQATGDTANAGGRSDRRSDHDVQNRGPDIGDQDDVEDERPGTRG